MAGGESLAPAAKKRVRGRTISLKIRLADFSTFTRAKSLNTATNYVDDLFNMTLEKAKGFKLGEQPIRLIGIQVSNLEQETEQLGLFGEITPGSEKKEKLHEAVDQIKDKFGEHAIKHRK